VFFYEHGTTSVWVALLTAAILTGGVVTAYAVWLAASSRAAAGAAAERWSSRSRSGWRYRLVVFYCGYSLVYVASVHAKSPPVRAYYGSLHPLLRLALSTLNPDRPRHA